MQNLEDKPWKMEEVLPRLAEGELEKSVEAVQGKDKGGMRRLPPERGGTQRQMAAASVHKDVLLDPKELHKRETDCAHANVDTLVGGSESTSSGEIAPETLC